MLAAIQNRPHDVTRVWVQEGRQDKRSQKLLDLSRKSGIAIRNVARREMDGEAGDLRHQGVLAWVNATVAGNQNDLDMLLDALVEQPFLLVLDGIEDPRNLGACLRTADAAGVHAVITPRDRAAGLTAVARKAAAGAAETMPIFQVSNLARCLRGLRDRGIWLVGLASEGEEVLYSSNLSGPLALVMGAEGQGLRRLSRELCDHLVRIPMLGSVESLNVSVATAVCLYEAVRQRANQTSR